jgi:hypothetical protein
MEKNSMEKYNPNTEKKRLTRETNREFVLADGLRIFSLLASCGWTFVPDFRHILLRLDITKSQDAVMMMKILNKDITNDEKIDLITQISTAFPLRLTVSEITNVMENGVEVKKRTQGRKLVKTPQELAEYFQLVATADEQAITPDLRVTTQLCEESLKELERSTHLGKGYLTALFLSLFPVSLGIGAPPVVNMMKDALHVKSLPELKYNSKTNSIFTGKKISYSGAIIEPIGQAVKNSLQHFSNPSASTELQKNVSPLTADPDEQADIADFKLKGSETNIKKLSSYFIKGNPLGFEYNHADKSLEFDEYIPEVNETKASQVIFEKMQDVGFAPKLETFKSIDNKKMALANSLLTPTPTKVVNLSVIYNEQGKASQIVLPISSNELGKTLVAEKLTFFDSDILNMIDTKSRYINEYGTMYYNILPAFADKMTDYIGNNETSEFKYQSPTLDNVSFEADRRRITIKNTYFTQRPPLKIGKYEYKDFVKLFEVGSFGNDLESNSDTFYTSVRVNGKVGHEDLRTLYDYLRSDQFTQDGGIVYSLRFNDKRMVALDEFQLINSIVPKPKSKPTDVTYEVSTKQDIDMNLPINQDIPGVLRGKDQSTGYSLKQSQVPIPPNYDGEAVFDTESKQNYISTLEFPEINPDIQNNIYAALSSEKMSPILAAHLNDWQRRIEKGDNLTKETVVKEVVLFVKSQFSYAKNTELNDRINGKGPMVQIKEISSLIGKNESITCFTANFLTSSILNVLGIKNMVFTGYYNGDENPNELNNKEAHAWTVAQIQSGEDGSVVVLADSTPDKKPDIIEINEPSILVEWVSDNQIESVRVAGILAVIVGILVHNRLILRAYLAKNNPKNAKKLIFETLAKLPEEDTQMCATFVAYLRYGNMDTLFNPNQSPPSDPQSIITAFINRACVDDELVEKIKKIDTSNYPEAVVEFSNLLNLIF